jgi:hypothetical protein
VRANLWEQMPSPKRSINVDDETWERAKNVAIEKNTTITAMVVDYLRTLSPETELNDSQLRYSTNFDHPLRAPTVKGKPVECGHPKSRDLVFVMICAACGRKVS